MWSGTCSLGSATSGSGKSGNSLATTAIACEATPVAMFADTPPSAVVVVSETAGFHHDSIPAEQDFLRSLSGLRVTVGDRVAQLAATRPRGVRAVVFASTSGDPPLSAAGRRVLLRYVRAGGGFVGIHSASDTYKHWPAFVRMLGGV